MSEPDYDKMNPGIRRTVLMLRRAGFNTCDSGDGQTHDHACDRADPYVSIRVEVADSLTWEALRLKRFVQRLGVDVSEVGFGDVWIQASYDPANDVALIDLVGMTDEDIGR